MTKATVIHTEIGTVVLTLTTGNSIEFEKVSQCVNYCRDNNVEAYLIEPKN